MLVHLAHGGPAAAGVDTGTPGGERGVVLAIFQKDLRLFLRDRGALFLTILAPIVMITIIALARYESEEPRPLVPVVDDDRGPVANAFIKLLGRHADVAAMDRVDAEHVVSALNRAPAAIVFPKGLSKNYLRGTASEITLLTDPAQAVALNTLRARLLLMDRDAAEIADPMHEDLLVYREHNLTGEELSPKALEQNVPGFTIMFVILAVVFGTSAGLHDELSSGTLERLLMAPAGFSWLLVGKLGARFVIGFVQTLVLLLWGRLFFGVSLGSSATALCAVAAALAAAAAALGLLVAAVASTREQTLPLSLATTLGLAALGGLWWPISVAPVWLQSVGNIFFSTWAMQAMTDLILRHRGLGQISAPIGVLALEAAVLLAAGLWLFRRRYSAR